MKLSLCLLVTMAALFLLPAQPVEAAETLCDPSNDNCRDAIIALINNEKVEIDVAFWFMQDARYEAAIVNRWKAGVRVRLLVDPRANPSYSGNAAILTDFANAGVPMRYRVASGILHWKLMLFAGQHTVEFGSANYSPNAFVPNTPYSDYVGETVYETDDPSVVQSFMTKFDDSWTDTTNFRNYANVSGTLTRTYPTYSIDPDLNFPPAQSYANRAVSAYNAEKRKIDVIMYRITDQRHTNAILSAHSRGVPIRMILENNQYHNPQYLWDAWNVDRLYAAGIPLRWRGHAGENHEKLVLLYGQAMTIFGSSNWTSASSDSQQEHNYFTTKTSIFMWFEDQFNRMWSNSAKATETVPFVPLPPDTPTNKSPASGASVSTSTTTLKWYPGPWGVVYDVYFGSNSNPPLAASNLDLGPSTSSTDFKTWTTPSLAAGTTYYWKIVSRTLAGLTKTGAVSSFTTPSSGGGGGGGGLPSGWSDADIGAVGAAGGASYGSGTFSVSGAGDDIWDTADAFNFAYKKMSGDGQLIARVASVENTAAWAKAGVMVRNTLNPNSKFALMLVSAGKGLAFQYRATTAGNAAQAAQTSGTPPKWVKIVRAGSTLSGYSSSDGATWTLVGKATIPMNASVFVGLAVSSHTTSAVCAATFDHVE